MGDAMRLDELEETLRVEALHDNDRPAEPDGSGDADPWRRVIERRRRQIGLPFAELPKPGEDAEDRQRLRWRLERERPQYPLRLARRSGGIQHPRAERLIGDRRRRIARRRLVEIE